MLGISWSILIGHFSYRVCLNLKGKIFIVSKHQDLLSLNLVLTKYIERTIFLFFVFFVLLVFFFLSCVIWKAERVRERNHSPNGSDSQARLKLGARNSVSHVGGRDIIWVPISRTFDYGIEMEIEAGYSDTCYERDTWPTQHRNFSHSH